MPASTMLLPIDAWLATRTRGRRLGGRSITLSTADLPSTPEVWVFESSPEVWTQPRLAL